MGGGGGGGDKRPIFLEVANIFGGVGGGNIPFALPPPNNPPTFSFNVYMKQ